MNTSLRIGSGGMLYKLAGIRVKGSAHVATEERTPCISESVASWPGVPGVFWMFQRCSGPPPPRSLRPVIGVSSTTALPPLRGLLGVKKPRMAAKIKQAWYVVYG